MNIMLAILAAVINIIGIALILVLCVGLAALPFILSLTFFPTGSLPAAVIMLGWTIALIVAIFVWIGNI